MIWSVADTSFTDEDITNLYDYTKEYNIQLNSLQIDDQSLSSDSVHLMSLIAPSPEEEEVEVIGENCCFSLSCRWKERPLSLYHNIK